MNLKKIIFYSFLIVSAGGIILTGIIYYKLTLACSRYYKEPLKNRNCVLSKHKVKHVTLETDDKVKISGLLIERPQAQRVLLICHGRWQTKESLLPLVDLFDKETIFLFDFRAHGSSEGELISFGFNESQDVKAASRFLSCNASTKDLPLFGLGISMGGVALLKAAHEGAIFSGLIIDSAFVELTGHMCNLFTKQTGLPNYLFKLSDYIFSVAIGTFIHELNSCLYIKSLNCPVLIIHSNVDCLIPVSDAYKLYNCAWQPKDLWITSGRHGTIFKSYPKEYKEKVYKFMGMSL